MIRTEKFCYCFSLESGAYVALVLSFAIVITEVMEFLFVVAVEEEDEEVSTTRLVLQILITSCAFIMFLCLFFATLKRQSVLVIPWLVLSIVVICFMIVYIVQAIMTDSPRSYILNIVLTGLMVYLWVIVYNYRLELVNEERLNPSSVSIRRATPPEQPRSPGTATTTKGAGPSSKGNAPAS